MVEFQPEELAAMVRFHIKRPIMFYNKNLSEFLDILDVKYLKQHGIVKVKDLLFNLPIRFTRYFFIEKFTNKFIYEFKNCNDLDLFITFEATIINIQRRKKRLISFVLILATNHFYKASITLKFYFVFVLFF